MISFKHIYRVLVLIICFVSIAQAALSSCTNYPCKNGGRCINQPNTFYGYNCICNPPWTGVNCDQNKNQVGGNNINDNRNPGAVPGAIPGANQYGYNNNQYGNNQYGNNQFDNRYGNDQYGNPLGNNQYGNNQYGGGQYGSNQYGSNQFGSNQYGMDNRFPNDFDNRYGNQMNNPYYESTQGACKMRPCRNGAYCQAGITPNHYKCLCKAGYYGVHCESYHTSKGALLGIILGTILPFFAIIVLISITLYCCCYKSK